MSGLTGPQLAMLEVVYDGTNGEPYSNRPMSPRQAAKKRWPDSPAWSRRTSSHGGNINGALGGTMPMNAAVILWRLEAKRLVCVSGEWSNQWTLTELGKHTVEEARAER